MDAVGGPLLCVRFFHSRGDWHFALQRTAHEEEPFGKFRYNIFREGLTRLEPDSYRNGCNILLWVRRRPAEEARWYVLLFVCRVSCRHALGRANRDQYGGAVSRRHGRAVSTPMGPPRKGPTENSASTRFCDTTLGKSS